MAGQITNLSDDPTKLLHERFLLNFGPYNHTAGNGAVALGAGPLQNDLGYITDRPYVIDTVRICCKTTPTAYRGFRLGWATSGQTIAQAATALQFFTARFDLDTLVNGTFANMTVDTTMNVLPEGARLFYDLDGDGGGSGSGTTDTALVGLTVMIRGSTRVL